MDNYEFCAQWVLDQEHAGVRVLDYGCGAGQIVKKLLSHQVDAVGCDVFYDGASYQNDIEPSLLNTTIREMSGDEIPFETSSFDIVINNQVMEHVEDLDAVLSEIQRVLRPGGIVLSLFPDKGVWREGHVGVLFLHWFPKKSGFRVYYAAACRLLGFGYHKGNKSAMQWSRDKCDYLDNWTHYRGRREIDSTYNKHFSDIRHIEDYWLRRRLGSRRSLAAWLPASIQKLVVRKLGGLVFVARKPA